jgi:hypothetical protein
MALRDFVIISAWLDVRPLNVRRCCLKHMLRTDAFLILPSKLLLDKGNLIVNCTWQVTIELCPLLFPLMFDPHLLPFLREYLL